MLVKVENKADLISKLTELMNKTVVFYYICSNCGDLQVTYDYEVNADLFEWLNKDDDSIWCDYDCTNCGVNDKFVNFNNVDYFEIMD